MIKYLLVLYRKTKGNKISCRYYPSCSYYAEEAIEKYGIIKGSFLGVKRVMKCNQFFPGGFDPVP